MNFYRQSILLFGIIVPFLICAIAIGICVYAIGDFQQTLKTRTANYETNLTLQAKIKGLKRKCSPNAPISPAGPTISPRKPQARFPIPSAGS